MSRLTIVLVLISLLLSAPLVSAQVGVRDRDGDGLPDPSDSCPDAAGPVENSGCPVSSDSPGAGAPTADDRDGDNVPNDQDGCPDTHGPTDHFGCPRDSVATPQAETSENTFRLPVLPLDGDCVVATLTGEGVNARLLPNASAEVVGRLAPQYIYLASLSLQLGDEIWILSENGWVAGWVTRSGGLCPTPMPLNLIDSETQAVTGLIFDPKTWGDPHVGETPLTLDSLFGDGSVMPQTREHILLARFDENGKPLAAIVMGSDENGTPTFMLLLPAVQMVIAACDGSVIPADNLLGDGSVIPADGIVNCDGSVLVGFDPLGHVLLLPASESSFDPQPDPPGTPSLLLPATVADEVNFYPSAGWLGACVTSGGQQTCSYLPAVQ
jgi:hypothetical protein